MTHPILPETGFVRLREVLKVFPVSKTTWWAGVKSGKFPKPIKLGPKMTAWRAEDIRALIVAMGGRDG
ncbi:MAG: AlpA family phage regulatory protein [Alphaproteobacteria bacterium]|jgi:prophage regulatory protein|nr:AlpA family phage regulatory protein [Alphaproteobacteria bacterium]